MPAETYVNVDGTFRRVLSDVYVNVAGVDRTCTYAYVNIAGGWQTVFVRDFVGPPVSPPLAEIGTQGNVLVTYQDHLDAVSGTASSYIEASYGGGAWVSIYIVPSPGVGGSFVDNVTARGARGQSCKYRLIAIDNMGNQSMSAESNVFQSRPLGVTTIYPIASGSWETLEGGGLGWWTDRVIGGAYRGHEQSGFWFYGTALNDLCRGHAPDLIMISMKQVFDLSGAGYAYLAGHDAQVAGVGMPGVGVIGQGPYLPGAKLDRSRRYFLPHQSVNFALPADWYSDFGSGAYRGVAVLGNGQPFKAIDGKSEDYYSGALTVYFN